MALPEGLKDFVSFITGGFTNSDNGGDDAFIGLRDSKHDYQVDGNLAVNTEEDLDAVYGPRTKSRMTDFGSFGKSEAKVLTHPNSYKSSELTVIEPRSFSEAAQIIKRIIDKKTVVLHLDLLDKEQSQRTVDFICGATHALGGSIEKITDKVFIFTPSNVTLSVENNSIQNKFTESLWNKPHQ